LLSPHRGEAGVKILENDPDESGAAASWREEGGGWTVSNIREGRLSWGSCGSDKVGHGLEHGWWWLCGGGLVLINYN